MFNIKDVHGVPWRSQTNGRAEAFNKKINVCLRSCLNESQWQDYDLWIDYIVFVLNSLKSSRTKYSANFLLFGREVMSIRDLYVQDDERVEQIREEMDDTNVKQLLAYNLYCNIADVTRKAAENNAV